MEKEMWEREDKMKRGQIKGDGFIQMERKGKKGREQ